MRDGSGASSFFSNMLPGDSPGAETESSMGFDERMPGEAALSSTASVR